MAHGLNDPEFIMLMDEFDTFDELEKEMAEDLGPLMPEDMPTEDEIKEMADYYMPSCLYLPPF